MSIENAAENAAAEAADVTFDEARATAENTWRDALSTIDVAGGTEAEQVKLYTALYHSLLHPNTYDDVDGEYFGYDGAVHRVEPGRHHYSTYSGWDMYRGQAQLVAMLFPDVASDINQSIVDLVDQSGYWPNWPHLGVAQQKMSGDSCRRSSRSSTRSAAPTTTARRRSRTSSRRRPCPRTRPGTSGRTATSSRASASSRTRRTRPRPRPRSSTRPTTSRSPSSPSAWATTRRTTCSCSGPRTGRTCSTRSRARSVRAGATVLTAGSTWASAATSSTRRRATSTAGPCRRT
ncbi:glycoside hydrolase domain-containing protein [Oerskovia sp. M15]